MRWWHPDPDEPELFDWWRPLLAAARRAREEHMHWLIHIHDFALFGRVERGPRPTIWRYRHCLTGYTMDVDTDGRTYQYISYETGRVPGRFKEISIRHAVWAAGLPYVDESVWYEPQSRSFEPDFVPQFEEDEGGKASAPSKRHLHLVNGG